MHFHNCDYHYFLFVQHFLVEIFKHKTEFYSEYPYTCHLESILYSIFYCTFFITYWFIYPSYFPDAFQCRLQTSVLLFQLSPLQKMVGSSLLSLLAFSSEFIELFFVWHNFSPGHMVLNILQFFLPPISKYGHSKTKTKNFS